MRAAYRLMGKPKVFGQISSELRSFASLPGRIERFSFLCLNPLADANVFDKRRWNKFPRADGTSSQHEIGRWLTGYVEFLVRITFFDVN